MINLLKFIMLFFFTLLILLVCIEYDVFTRKNNYNSLPYKLLPKSVKKAYDSIYHKTYDGIPKNEFFSLNNGENCYVNDIDWKFFVTKNYELRTSKNRKTKISSNFYENVYIIKNDTLFFPDCYKTGGVLTYKGNRAQNIRIDTLMFNYEILKPINK